MNQMTSDRVTFRRFKISDLDNMRKLESDPDIMKFTPSKVPHSFEQSEKRLISLVAREAELAPLGVWAAELTESGDFVGWFMLLATDLKFPELGFMIVKEYWNKGLATEISQALILHGFNELKFIGLSARTNVDNTISMKVLEKLGFKNTGLMKSADGTELKVYELSLADFNQLKLR